MADMIECSTHGQCQATYVCTHLAGETAGLGFHHDPPTDEDPFPDAFCHNCNTSAGAQSLASFAPGFSMNGWERRRRGMS